MDTQPAIAGDLKNETRAKHRGHMPERKKPALQACGDKRDSSSGKGESP